MELSWSTVRRTAAVAGVMGLLAVGACSSNPDGAGETDVYNPVVPTDDSQIPVGTGSPGGAPAPAAGGPGDPIQDGAVRGGQVNPELPPGQDIQPPGPEANTPGRAPDDDGP